MSPEPWLQQNEEPVFEVGHRGQRPAWNWNTGYTRRELQARTQQGAGDRPGATFLGVLDAPSGATVGLRTCSVFSKPCATSPSVRWVGSRETVGAICYLSLDNFARKWEDLLLQMSPQWP